MYGEGKEEGRRKKEEALREEKPYMAVDIFPTFTREDTNGHDIINRVRRQEIGDRR